MWTKATDDFIGSLLRLPDVKSRTLTPDTSGTSALAKPTYVQSSHSSQMRWTTFTPRSLEWLSSWFLPIRSQVKPSPSGGPSQLNQPSSAAYQVMLANSSPTRGSRLQTKRCAAVFALAWKGSIISVESTVPITDHCGTVQ